MKLTKRLEAYASEFDDESPALAAVCRWSVVIHPIVSAQHAWCLAAARALLSDVEVPPWPGGRKSTGASRLDTIRRIIASA